MRPLTTESSKAVIRIFNRPLVEFAMVELARQGVKHFIFGAKGYVNYRNLFDYFREGIGFSYQYRIEPRAHIKYQPRVDDVGSADSVRILIDYYNIQNDVLVVQGDNLFELNLRELLEFKEKKGAFMVVVLTPVEDVEAYGVADMDESGRIRRFVEKPRKNEAPSRMANTGIYLISPEVRRVFDEPPVQEMMREKGRLDFGLDFIPYLVERYPVYGYYLRGEWQDVGTPAGYLKAMTSILRKGRWRGMHLGEQVPKLPNVWIQGGSVDSVRRREEIVRKALAGQIRLEGRVFIGRHCQVEEGAIVRDSCIDNFCILGKGVTIERSAIMDRVLVGDGAVVQDSIVGRHSRIRSTTAKPTWLLGLSVVGDDVDIGEGAFLASTKVDPHQNVAAGANMKDEYLREPRSA
jgi:NDP-sugar pyrophosphorylase family protein